jgi:hypothetical protein
MGQSIKGSGWLIQIKEIGVVFRYFLMDLGMKVFGLIMLFRDMAD